MIRYDNGNFKNYVSENLGAKKKPEHFGKNTVLFLSVYPETKFISYLSGTHFFGKMSCRFLYPNPDFKR